MSAFCRLTIEKVVSEDPWKTIIINEFGFSNYEDAKRAFTSKIESLEKVGYECEERGDWRHVFCVKKTGEVIEEDGLEVIIPKLDKLYLRLIC